MIVLHNLTNSSRTVSFSAVPWNRQLLLVVGYLKIYPDDDIILHDPHLKRESIELPSHLSFEERVARLEGEYQPVYSPMPEKD